MEGGNSLHTMTQMLWPFWPPQMVKLELRAWTLYRNVNNRYIYMYIVLYRMHTLGNIHRRTSFTRATGLTFREIIGLFNDASLLKMYASTLPLSHRLFKNSVCQR